MKYAETIYEIPNAFRLRPLEKEDLERFYCDETMEVRTGDEDSSPIEDIFDGCHTPSEQNVYLLLGHRGCGKSTELNAMSERLRAEGCHVRTVQCDNDVDLMNLSSDDLLILMGRELIDIADELKIDLDRAAKKTILSFWDDVEKEERTKGLGGELGVELSLPGKFATVRANLKLNDEIREIYRDKLQKRANTWLDAMNDIAAQITDELDGKQPVIIFEELDKLSEVPPEKAWAVFQNVRKLTSFSFPVIYTFPIALSYDPRFRTLEEAFQVKVFPMMKLMNKDGTSYQRGKEVIKQIVRIRADPDLFEDEALDLLIRMTGGSLRDLFRAITVSSTRTRRRITRMLQKREMTEEQSRQERVSMEDANRALLEQKSLLTRRIERKHYGFLAYIYRGNRENIEKHDMLLDMLLAGAVLEYNGERWHNLHPLIAQYLEEQNLTNEPYFFKTGAVNNGGAGAAGEPEAGSYG